LNVELLLAIFLDFNVRMKTFETLTIKQKIIIKITSEITL